MIKVAVVGYGNMGKNHVRVLDALGAQVSIIESDYDRWPHDDVHNTYSRLDILFADKDEMPDAVIVASPTSDHYRSALAALEAGCHVLVEKPFTEKISQGVELVAKSGSKLLMCGLIERFNPAVQVLKEALADFAAHNEHPQLIEARRSGFTNFDPVDGVTSDLATHDIDMINYLAGQEPVETAGYRGPGAPLESVSAGILRYPSGLVGSYTADWLSPAKTRKLRVVCSNGTFELDYIAQTLMWHPVGFPPEPVEVRHAEPLALELSYFLNHVATREPDQMNTVVAALNALQIVKRTLNG